MSGDLCRISSWQNERLLKELGLGAVTSKSCYAVHQDPRKKTLPEEDLLRIGGLLSA